jgi:hypothetical protein
MRDRCAHRVAANLAVRRSGGVAERAGRSHRPADALLGIDEGHVHQLLLLEHQFAGRRGEAPVAVVGVGHVLRDPGRRLAHRFEPQRDRLHQRVDVAVQRVALQLAIFVDDQVREPGEQRGEQRDGDRVGVAAEFGPPALRARHAVEGEQDRAGGGGRSGVHRRGRRVRPGLAAMAGRAYYRQRFAAIPLRALSLSRIKKLLVTI